MEEKKKYRFADEKEQLKRVNSFLATGYTIFYIVILSVSWESYFRRRTDTWLYRAAQRSDTDSDGD
ncbi:MAG: hypothetical protein ACLUWE_10895 [Lachnospira sp.]